MNPAVNGEGLLDKRPYYRRKNGRDALSWGTTSELDVRDLTYGQWWHLDRQRGGPATPVAGAAPRR